MVLVIDDSADTHVIVEARLGGEGVVLHGAMDGEEGLAMVEAVGPDLILLDIDMPGMSGFEVLWRLKSRPETANIPVIFLTGATDAAVKVQAFDLGAVDFITKPFDAHELKARVRSALRTKRYQDLLAERAQVDAMTGLWNRGYFDRRLAEEVAAGARQGRQLGVILIDLDHFKQVNDLYGHPFGDRVIQRVAEVIGQEIRSHGAPCRYGGEEFAIILPNANEARTRALAERLRELIAGVAVDHKMGAVRVTASLGLAATDHLSAAGPSLAQVLVMAADDALYAAKRAGRNRVSSAAVVDADYAVLSAAP